MTNAPQHTFTMTEQERRVSDLVTEMIGSGEHSLTDATLHAITALPNPRPEFVLWVSGGTVAPVPDGYVRIGDLDFSKG